MPRSSNRDTLRAWARMGAMRRLEELRQEEAVIRANFPELFRGRPGRPPAVAPDTPKAAAAPANRRRRRRRAMSASQRRAVSERMKKYWAERRKKG
ncbi:MAG TPA: hypothetical protein VEK56_10070 [Vicinamibacterales bacterium]|nr:hypothetical protein [Vicinamibacterales bacterium]